jgi:hypothetical protein
VNTAVKLKLGPVKRAHRIAVKVEEYRAEKGEATWPHSQFVTDVLRASGPVKRANRIAVKVEEYRDEKGEATWPHSQFAADVPRHRSSSRWRGA